MDLLATGLVVYLVIVYASLESTGVISSRRGLTAETARLALVRLLRNRPTAFQREFRAYDLARRPLIADGAGQYTCDGFRISVPGGSYNKTVQYGCVWEYEGTFILRDGRWTASKPRWRSVALTKE
jgi:hypothetical protein